MPEVRGPYEGLVANDVGGVLGWYEARRASLMDQPFHLYNWSRLLCSLKRGADVKSFLDILAGIEEYSMFVAGQRLIDAMAAGMTPAEALKATPLGAAERHRNAIMSALSEFNIAETPPEIRHIAISGISFCGSTVLDMLLEGLPGVASIGESIWLTRGWEVAFPFGETSAKGVQDCNICGSNCAYLTPNFRTALGLNPVDWYYRIANRLKTKILVSSDKNLPKIVLNEPQLRLTGLAVFKSPKQAWASNYAKVLNTPEATFDGMVKFMDVWKSAYSEILHDYKPKGGKVFVNFDRFAEAPESMFRSLVRALDLEYDPIALVSPSTGHSLGGNSNAINRVHKAGHRVSIYKLPDPIIPADHAMWIDAQPDLNELHDVLKRFSADDLARVA